MVEDVGAMLMEAKGPVVTVKVAVEVKMELVPVTVWLPALVEVQEEPVQELPLPAMVKVVEAVTSPRELPKESKPVAE